MAGRLALLVTAVLVGYAGYKLFLPDVSEAMWTVVLVLCLLSFLVDVLRHPARLKGLQAAFPLLAGLTAMLIYFVLASIPPIPPVEAMAFQSDAIMVSPKRSTNSL